MFLLGSVAALIPISTQSLVVAGPSEAYPLTKENGPWMVLVKAFRGPRAVELANTLALELRREHKIPAYTFTRARGGSKLVRQSGLVKGIVRSYDESVVLAGDFKRLQDGQKLLKRIKSIQPKSIPNVRSLEVSWSRRPLRGVMVPNPLRPNQSRQKKPDPLLLKINAGKYSLYNCPGPYSLRVFSYQGASALSDQQWKDVQKKSLLKLAGEYAEKITRELRRVGFEAYVYHGYQASWVYVGSFSSARDPAVVQISRQLAAKRVLGHTLLSRPILVPIPRR